MEYKFKTVFLNNLIPCSINEFENSIRTKNGCRIGKLKNRGLEAENRIPMLPVFQYIGKEDIDGEEIYCGHLVRNRAGIEYEVVFDKGDASFSLENQEELIRMSNFDSYKIIGHSRRGIAVNVESKCDAYL